MADKKESLEFFEDICAIMGEGPQAMFWKVRQMDRVLQESQRLSQEKPHIRQVEGDGKEYLMNRMMHRMMHKSDMPPHMGMLLSSMSGKGLDMASMMSMFAANAGKSGNKNSGVQEQDKPKPEDAIIPEPVQEQPPVRSEVLNLPGVEMSGRSIKSQKKSGGRR